MLFKSIDVLGVTEEMEDYERNVINYLNADLTKANSDFKLNYISANHSDSVDTLMKAMDTSKKVILITDAKIGKTPVYEQAVKMMYERDIKPLLLVTHVESSEDDLNEIKLIPTYIIANNFLNKIRWTDHVYPAIFFDFNEKHYFKPPDYVEPYDVEELVQSLKSYIN